MEQGNITVRKPVRIAMIGAGNRARKYLDYILSHPDRAIVTAVVDPNPLRRREMARHCNVKAEYCLETADRLFAVDDIADAVIIASPDHCHYSQAMGAIAHGLHVLLEKPVAQTAAEAREIAEAARHAGVVVNVCYVLHFHPYFIKIKELVESGRYGKIASVSHRAPVGIDRATHVYVRGPWGRKENAGPLFTSKCCHDLDFLLWLTQRDCKRLTSYGSLKWFTAANAPEGSACRCIDCSVEASCPYSAVDLYSRRRDWISNFDIQPGETIENAIDRELEYGTYGTCVYRCDNDVVDRQVVAMEMEGGITVDMTIDVFTRRNNRITTITLTNGEIYGDETSLTVTRFVPYETETFDFSDFVNAPYHAGADLLTVDNFLDSIEEKQPDPNVGINQAVKSQHLCDLIEQSRLQN